MTVESLLKTIAYHTAVILKDTNGKTLINFNYSEDVEVFSPVFLYRIIIIIKQNNVSKLIEILSDTMNY